MGLEPLVDNDGMMLVPPVGSLPDALNARIGRIVVAYSFLEYQLQFAIRNLTGLGEKEQRLVLREPRASDRLDMILDLVHVHGLPVSVPKSFGADLKKVASERDALAHGIWSIDNGIWYLIRTSGSWGKNEITDKRRSRKITPQGMEITEKNLDALWHKIIELIGVARKLVHDIADALEASPRTPL